MSKFVDSVISFLGRRSSKDQAAEPAVTRRPRGDRKAVLKADSFVFLPGECSNGSYLWGEVITPRTVGVPLSSHSDDYSSLRRKNVQSVLIDGNSGKVLGRRLSGSFVCKAVKGCNNLDEVEDESLEAFLKEFEAEGELEEQYYHTYDHAERRTEKATEDDRYIYDRLIHLPQSTPGPPASRERRQVREEAERKSRQTNNRVLDLRESSGRRRSSSGGSAEHYYSIPADQIARGERREGAVDWDGLREQLKMAAVRGKPPYYSAGVCSRKRHRDKKS